MAYESQRVTYLILESMNIHHAFELDLIHKVVMIHYKSKNFPKAYWKNGREKGKEYQEELGIGIE